MKIRKIAEYEIDGPLKNKLQQLVTSSFGEDYPSDRIYYKQLPHLRFVVSDEENEVIGQVGLDYRVMNLNGNIVNVLGLIDLCVLESRRSEGIGSFILREIDAFCTPKPIDFILLFADDASLYSRNGYVSITTNCKWMQIDETTQTTIGLGHEQVEELMVKSVHGRVWEEGDLDLMGYLY
ncbi:GNAT family N-acetyltransferase [Sporosarcina siberiensis]|uniref:GNAT family N-acetyltransferase n=1 Tax=Sporosarcina siberiensis TaxID=1365606 RepID=A0ABW4SH31_9BACL